MESVDKGLESSDDIGIPATPPVMSVCPKHFPIVYIFHNMEYINN